MSDYEEKGTVVKEVVDLIEERQFSVVEAVLDPVTEDKMLVRMSPDGDMRNDIQMLLDERASNPRRRKGTAIFSRLESFIEHVNRFGDSDSAVFANENREFPALTAVLDYHRKDVLATEGDADTEHGEYRWGEHRSSFLFPLSDEWSIWNAMSGSKMSMGEFGLFLEKHMGDIAFIDDDVPERAKRFVEMNGGAEMIADWQALDALARGLRIDENAVAEEKVNLSTGEGKIELTSEHAALVNGASFVVPRMFFIAIPVFKNGEFYRLPCSLRYRKTREGINFWFDLWRADLAFGSAFTEAVDKVGAETLAQMFFGSPE